MIYLFIFLVQVLITLITVKVAQFNTSMSFKEAFNLYLVENVGIYIAACLIFFLVSPN